MFCKHTFLHWEIIRVAYFMMLIFLSLKFHIPFYKACYMLSHLMHFPQFFFCFCNYLFITFLVPTGSWKWDFDQNKVLIFIHTCREIKIAVIKKIIPTRKHDFVKKLQKLNLHPCWPKSFSFSTSFQKQ